VFFLLLGRTDQSVQQTVGTLFKVHIFWAGRTTVRTWHIFRGRILGVVLVCCKWISLAGNVFIVVDMYFPEAE
jgi:hypothetical protein